MHTLNKPIVRDLNHYIFDSPSLKIRLGSIEPESSGL